MSQPVEASLVIAGEVELTPDRGRKPNIVSCAVVVRFDDPNDLKRAMAGEPVVMRWIFERKPEVVQGGLFRA